MKTAPMAELPATAYSFPTAGKPDEILANYIVPFIKRWKVEGLPGGWWTCRTKNGKERLDLFWQGDAKEVPRVHERMTSWVADWPLLDETPKPPSAMLPPWPSQQDSRLRDALFASYGEAFQELTRRWPTSVQNLRQAARIRGFHLLLSTGIAAVFPEKACTISFLRYYRNAILRHLVLRARLGTTKVTQLLSRFESEAEAWRPEGLRLLQHLPEKALAADSADSFTGWKERLLELKLLAEGVTSTSDPFAGSSLECLLLKTFHNSANQAGLRLLDEGLAVHLLLLAQGAKPEELTCTLLPARLRHAEPANDEDLEVFDFEKLYLWPTLTASTGNEGRRWTQLYGEKIAKLSPKVRKAVTALREKKVEEGEALLAVADKELERLRLEEPISGEVMARFFYGAKSYLQFVQGDFEGARMALDQAAQAVLSAVGRARFLIAFSAVSIDIPLKRARLARDLGQWDEAQSHLLEVFEMLMGKRPLVSLGNGETIGFLDIAETFAALPEGSKLDPALRFLREPLRRQRYFLHLAGGLCRPPQLFLT